MKKQALLLAGNIRDQEERNRYINDIGLAHEVLSNFYGFDNVDICFYKGRYIYYNNHKLDIQEASRDQVIELFKNYASSLQENDLFVLAVTNHGCVDDVTKEPLICLHDEEMLCLRELKYLLNNIVCPKVVVMGQCCGGNIFDYPVREAFYVSAAQKDQSTYSLPPQNNNTQRYDEFFYHFFSYLKGGYPNGQILRKSTNFKCTLMTLQRAIIFSKHKVRSLPMCTRRKNS